MNTEKNTVKTIMSAQIYPCPGGCNEYQLTSGDEVDFGREWCEEYCNDDCDDNFAITMYLADCPYFEEGYHIIPDDEVEFPGAIHNRPNNAVYVGPPESNEPIEVYWIEEVEVYDIDYDGPWFGTGD